MINRIEFRHFKGHVEVFINGVFSFSADTIAEAKRELDKTDGEA